MRLKNVNLGLGCQIFKAFSDESRVRILHLIQTSGEMCISDLEQVLDFTQTKTSRHLAYLKNSGLLNRTRHNQWVFYFIKEEYQGITSQMLQLLEKDLELSDDLERYKTLYANNVLAIRHQHNLEGKYELPEL